MNLSRELDDNNCPLPPGGVHTETAKGLHSSGGGAGRGGGVSFQFGRPAGRDPCFSVHRTPDHGDKDV